MDQPQPFSFNREPQVFRVLENLYQQYVNSTPDSDIQFIQEKIINVAFPVLGNIEDGWGIPPKILGTNVFFRYDAQKKKFLSDGNAKMRVEELFQICLAELIDSDYLRLEHKL